ncbi:MAG: acetate--CoA ligase family protein [Synergistaceae bacterium]|nr:acetate--CoA ligase family protein [Synergistaceae bacterium]
MNIDKLMKPRKICIVGASEKEGFGGDTCRNVISHMDENRYFLVNPKRNTIFGKKAYPSVSDVPEDFDLAVICTPASSVEQILRDAAARGARGAVVYASGYKEVGTAEGLAAQESLKELCDKLDIALMGPNCAGYINYIDAIYPFAFISEERDRTGSIGFVSQSGQLCLSMMDNLTPKFSFSISAGNCAITEMEDYIDFLVDDEFTKVIAVYLEGAKNPTKLADSFRKAAFKRKPVVVLKTGKSEKGCKLAVSHTGSLAGSDKAYDAFFKKFGVIRVDDLEELIYTAHLFATLKELPKHAGFASISLSGGETGICADVASAFGVEFPDFAPDTTAKLRVMLPSYASPANPLDATATLSYNAERFAACLRVLVQDEAVATVLLGYTLLQKIADPAIRYMAEAIKTVSEENGAKPMIMVSFAGNTRNEEYKTILESCGVPILPPTLYAFKILRYLADFIGYDYRDHDLSLAIPSRPCRETRQALSEHAAKEVVARYGIPFPKEAIAQSIEEAKELARGMAYPLAAKIDSTDILHKSDIGCVKLNIRDEAELEAAYGEILANALEHRPEACIGGVNVQEMAKAGVEMIVGVTGTPQFGPAVLVGMGGVFVEVFEDTALALAPLSREEARNLILSLKGTKLLTGYRGSAPCDLEAIVDVLLAISKMASDRKDDLVELDMNPVFVYERGVCAVDAVLVSDGGA